MRTRLTKMAGVIGRPRLVRPGNILADPLTTAASGGYWEGLGTNIPLIAKYALTALKYCLRLDSLLQCDSMREAANKRTSSAVGGW